MTLPKCIVCEGEPLYRSYDHNCHSVLCYNCGYGIINCTSERQAHTAWTKLNTPPEQLQLVESPDDWVTITDPEHYIRKCDQCRLSTSGQWGTWGYCCNSVNQQIKDWPDYSFQCRRKDLPVKAPVTKPPTTTNINAPVRRPAETESVFPTAFAKRVHDVHLAPVNIEYNCLRKTEVPE